MASLTWMIDVINKETSKTILKALQSTSKSSVNKVKNKRTEIINQWFGDFNGSEFAATNVQEVQTAFSVNGLVGGLSILSWTESSMLPTHESAERWLSKPEHEGGKPSNEYVADLVFDEGIIGLPLFSQDPTYSGWGWLYGINLNFHQKTPLCSALSDDANWQSLYNEIENDIMSKIN